MKAVVLETPGAAENLIYKDWPDPEPSAGEVVVRLKTAALNRRDLAMRAASTTPVPVILGSDGAGTIASLGEGVSGLNVGDEVLINSSLGWNEGDEAPPPGFRVLGSPDNGTYAELIKIPAENIFAKPASFNWNEAGAFPLAALTAYRALFTRGRLKTGETLIVPGAGSGVSTFLIQMAKAVGARVIVTSSSNEKLEKARELGADEIINYVESDWVAEVRRLTGKRGGDLTVDSVGQATWGSSVKATRSGGRMVVLGATTGARAELSVYEIFGKQLNLLGTAMGNRREFGEVLRFYDEKGLKPVVDRVFSLEETAASHHYLAEGRQFGKVVLAIS